MRKVGRISMKSTPDENWIAINNQCGSNVSEDRVHNSIEGNFLYAP